MGKDRREFIKAGLLGGSVLAAGVSGGVAAAASTGERGGGVAASSSTGKRSGGGTSMHVLVLGGTGFIGPHMVREALRRGHRVTLFNRGRTDVTLFPDLELIKGDRAGSLDGLADRQFDAVVDNSGYVPRYVENSSRRLSANVGQYVFVSTVSVYESFARANDENSPLGKLDDESVEEVTGTTYGPLKALCERRVREQIGEDRTTILRPGYICGPGDRTDRFTYWPVRTMQGGEMLWPGSPSHTVQIIDVRDLANFVVDSLEQKITGVYNTVIPPRSYTMGALLENCRAVTASTVEPVWADDAFLAEAQAKIEARNWGAFPIWHPAEGEFAGASSFANARALAAGLENRPVRETIRDLLAWWQTLPEERTSNLRAGLTAEQEAELLEALGSA